MRLIGDFFRIESPIVGLPQGQSGFNIMLNPDHIIYKAHFPGMPITPGVCILQMIQEIFSEKEGKPLYISRIKNAKFTNMISPVNDPSVSVIFSSFVEEEGGIRTQGMVTRLGSMSEVFLKFSLFLQTESV